MYGMIQMKNAKRDGMRVTQVKTRVFRDANNTLRSVNLDNNQIGDAAGVVWNNIMTNNGGVIFMEEKEEVKQGSDRGSTAHSRRSSGSGAIPVPTNVNDNKVPLSPTPQSSISARGSGKNDGKDTATSTTTSTTSGNERKMMSRTTSSSDGKRSGKAAVATVTGSNGEVAKPRTAGGAITIMDKVEKPKVNADKAAAAAAAAAKKADKASGAERDVSFSGMKHALERVNLAGNPFTDDIQQRLLSDARVTLGSVVKRVPPVDPNATPLVTEPTIVDTKTRGAAGSRAAAAASRTKSPATPAKRGVSTERT
jgi:hypothetical protein